MRCDQGVGMSGLFWDIDYLDESSGFGCKLPDLLSQLDRSLLEGVNMLSLLRMVSASCISLIEVNKGDGNRTVMSSLL